VNSTWGRFIVVMAAWSLPCFIAWAAAGPIAALLLLASGLFLYAVWHYRHISELKRWLQDPRPETVPEGWGVWDEVFADLYRMLRRQNQSESRLTATLHDLQQASAAMPDGMVILDANDRIEWCNPKAEEHLGLDRTHDIGQQITYIVRQPRFSEYLHAQSFGDPLVLRQSRGRDFILSVQLVPYGDRQKLVISRDITDLERVETMRRDFIANVSHELRTPLTVLGGFLETISDMKAGDSALIRRSLPLMMDQARRMQHLVEDLLTLSRLESSTSPHREMPVDVPALVRSLYRDACALSGGRHRVTLELASEEWINGAEDELRSAFTNLISNAIGYTPERGEITISWRRVGEVAVFSVRDTGIGIESHHIPRLTERFYRVDRSRSRETGGTGLGLAIVKHVLNRHKAHLEIMSEPGRGSTFSAEFPAERVLTPRRAEAMARSA